MAQPGRKKREDSPYAEQSQRLSVWVRSLRESAGLSQDQLARRANVTLATLRKLEAGKIVNPGHFIVMALLGALNARPEELSAFVGPAAAIDEQLRYATTETVRHGRMESLVESQARATRGFWPSRGVTWNVYPARQAGTSA